MDLGAVHRLRTEGQSWRDIAQALRVTVRTVRRSWQLWPNPGVGFLA
ncbi:hypothetical protein HI113_13505 [Corallococcus exiguus]|nr:hypothetical protein [Corallococcus exiguus]NPC47719.1 hypothetical protein [Corallococcus exiguus]NPD23367.1 hypothetical protein [Corallococcus exiguus]RKH79319.1 hypothetical protein D7X99_25380 [Corallococcus sp. AB032C]RKH98176.1 hypothetical protein D7Y04_24810 [Corallococcus sp. AB038B]